MGEPRGKKTLFLVRHAQSEQNVAVRDLKAGKNGALLRVISLGWDAPLSPAGRSQLEEARATLADFAKVRRIQLVAHSPYVRAKDTARAIFDGRAEHIVELPCIYERGPWEYFFPSFLDARVAQFRDWLASREETCIAVVGHGQFFKVATGAPSVQANVSIVQVEYSDEGGFGARELAYQGFRPKATAT